MDADVIDAVRIAVLLPCYNEAAAIEEVVAAFRQALPAASIHVFDNGSSDATAALAARAGASVSRVGEKGKGSVTRRMFADVEADVYVMADGDLTYDASVAPAMVARLLDEGLDMLVARRVDEQQKENYRFAHRFGNALLTGTVQRLFGGSFRDMLSGYRVFSRRFVKSFPAQSRGFEIETELTVHALEQRMPCAETRARYMARPAGSVSKLSTWRDGLSIMATIARLYMIERPLAFYFTLAAALMLTGVGLAVPLFIEYFATGLVPRIPTAVLCVGLVLVGFIAIVLGLLLDAMALGRRETRRMAYLAIKRAGRPAQHV